MPYYLDLTAIPLSALQQRLKTTPFLLPSQAILKEDIDARFKILTAQGIQTVADLQTALKTKAKVAQFAQTSGLPLDFLTVLRREVNSHHPADRKIADFPHIAEALKRKLTAAGITTAKALYERAAKKTERARLQKKLGISAEEMLLLAKSADLSRLRYVNPPFAALLAFSRFDTVDKLKAAAPQALYEELLAVNQRRHFFSGRINRRDMDFLIEDPLYAPCDIE